MQFVRRWWAPLSAIFFVVIGACLTVHYWDWLHVELPNGRQDRSATIRNVGLVVAAPVALVLAVWRSIIAQEQAGIAQEQVETARRSLRGERFQKAAEMLVSDFLPTRLGGIHGLCQLARDYPKEFHIQVILLLAAFVRYPPPEYRRKDTQVVRTAREDIQEIIFFLGKRSNEGQAEEIAEDSTIDLSTSDLRGILFPRGSSLQRIRLLHANLTGAYFHGVQDLTQEQLGGAWAYKRNIAIFNDTFDAKTGEPLDSAVLCIDTAE